MITLSSPPSIYLSHSPSPDSLYLFRSTGKFDLTLGPWSWSRYADAFTTSRVQSQGSTCQCAFNALEWREATLQRLSDMPRAALEQALPLETCGDGGGVGGGGAATAITPLLNTSSPSSLSSSSSYSATPDVCAAATGKEPLSVGTEIEWSGKFALVPGSTYTWTFHASTGCVDGVCNTTYPDPAIVVLVVSEAVLAAAAAAAAAAAGGGSGGDGGVDDSSMEGVVDAAMKARANNTISHGGAIDLGGGGGDGLGNGTRNGSLASPRHRNRTAQKLVPIKTVLRMNTIVQGRTDAVPPAGMVTAFTLRVPAGGNSMWWVFTQHVPQEFSANFLKCEAGGTASQRGVAVGVYVYPSDTSLYLGRSAYVNGWEGRGGIPRYVSAGV